jgi:phosphoglycolate phosphatase
MILNKRAIIFDFDGTLVDTMQVFADVASGLIAAHYGMDKDAARKKYFETSGFPFWKQLEIIFPGHPMNAKVAPSYEEQKLIATADIPLDAETREALRSLRRGEYDLAISSNNFQHNVSNFVEKNGLQKLFSLVLGHKENFSKGREHFDFVSHTLGISPKEMLFIGDSINDAKLAQESGVDFVAKLGTFTKKDFHKFDKSLICINAISDLIN